MNLSKSIVYNSSGANLAEIGAQETSSVTVETVQKVAKSAQKLGPVLPNFKSDATKVTSKGMGLKKAYLNKHNQFTVHAGDAGKWRVDIAFQKLDADFGLSPFFHSFMLFCCRLLKIFNKGTKSFENNSIYSPSFCKIPEKISLILDLAVSRSVISWPVSFTVIGTVLRQRYCTYENYNKKSSNLKL